MQGKINVRTVSSMFRQETTTKEGYLQMVASTDSKGGNGAVSASKDVKGDARSPVAAGAAASGNSRISLGSSSSAVASGVMSATNQSVAKPATSSGATNATERSNMSKQVVESKPDSKPEIKSDIKSDKALTAKETVEQKSKLKAIEQAMGQIEKAYGKGSIMRLDGDLPEPIQGISTGALSLDLALGGRGLPRGRVVEIFGPESSGKTTLALTAIANTQREGGVAAFIDAEHALDPSWAKRLGVNLDEILVSQPDTGEQALEICEMLVRSNAVNMVVIDSVAALIPRAEIEGEMGDSHMGLQARLMSQALRKLTGAIAKSDCVVVFINQLREKIGVMFGSPETTTGGRALKFYATVRIDIRRIGQIKEGDRIVGNRIKTKVVKNKIAPPFREAEFDIMFDEGISTSGDVLDMATADEVVDKSGSWFSYGATRLGQGREGAKLFLRQNPALLDEIRKAVMVKRLANPNGIPAKLKDESDDE
jgi:recombination protein RecA